MTENKDALAVGLVDAIISAYNSTRLSHVPAVDHVLSSRLVRQSIAAFATPPVKQDAMREAAQDVLDHMFSTYTARNGREVGVQGDDGEKVWFVHSDQIEALRTALSSPNVAGEREALDLNSDLLPAARAAADAAMAQTADEFDINDSADAQRWMDARNGAWFALSTSQPESVADVHAALAEAIEALGLIMSCTAHIHNGKIVFDCGDPYEIAAQVVAKHGDIS